MAVVVNGPGFGPELGFLMSMIDNLQTRGLHNAYNKEMMNLLSSTEDQKKLGAISKPINYDNNSTLLNDLSSVLTPAGKDSTGQPIGQLGSNSTMDEAGNVGTRRDLNENELYDLYMNASMKGNTIGTAYPKNMREDVYGNVIDDLIKKKAAMRARGSERPNDYELRDIKTGNLYINPKTGRPVQIPSIGVPSMPNDLPKDANVAWKKQENPQQEMSGRILSMIDNTPDDDPRKPGLIEWGKSMIEKLGGSTPPPKGGQTEKPITKTIDGKTYIQKGGKWYKQ
jgi:hypothetical protein